MSEWRTMESAPKDGTRVFVATCQATVWLVRLAGFNDGSFWEESGFESRDECAGWWSADNCVGDSKVSFEPQWWMRFSPPAVADAGGE